MHAYTYTYTHTHKMRYEDTQTFSPLLPRLFCASIIHITSHRELIFTFFFVSSCAITAFVKHVLHLTLNQPLLKLTNTHSSQLTKPAKCTERTDNLEWEQRHKKYSCLGNWHPAIHFYVIYAETCQILQAIHTLFNSFVQKPNKSCPSLLPSHWCHILYLPGELA